MKPTNRKKQARPQIRRERRESTINAMVQRKKLEKGSMSGVGGWDKDRRKEKASTQKHKPSLPVPPTMGKRKEKGRKRNGGREEITKEQIKENISESSNQEKNRDGFCFSQQPNALRR